MNSGVEVWSGGMFEFNTLYNLKDAKYWIATGISHLPFKTINLEVPSGSTKIYHKQMSYTSSSAKLLTRYFYNSNGTLLLTRSWVNSPYFEETAAIPTNTAYIIIEIEDYDNLALSAYWNINIKFS